jgi:hydrogenase maturation factor HypF (carbamoyltransferase family)
VTERRIVRFRGLVQGVGFRYKVERIALRFPGVAGRVYNEANHVTLDIEGTAADLSAFIAAIVAHPPRSARIESTETVTVAAAGHQEFGVGPTR